jgi:hypothetical protein
MDTDNLSIRTKGSVEEGLVELSAQPGPVLYVNYQPGNGTAYRFTLHECPAGSPLSGWHFSGQGGWLVVFVPESRYRPFAFQGYIDPLYFAEKTGCSLSDAVVLVEVLKFLTERGK